jgi:hypothetical protein
MLLTTLKKKPPSSIRDSIVSAAGDLSPQAITAWRARSYGLTCVDSNRMTPPKQTAIGSGGKTL